MRFLRRTALLCAISLIAASSSAQTPAAPVDPHKQIVDHLNALGDFPGTWRFHTADIAHGEAVDLDDSAWEIAKPNHKWTGGGAWFRSTIEIPSTLHGYDLTDSTLMLDFNTDDDAIVYVNGARVSMGEVLEPTMIAQHIKPGDKFVVAIKSLVLSGDHNLRTRLKIIPGTKRPNPLTIAEELRSADSLIATLADNPAERKQQLEAAFQAVDEKALANGNQAAFDASLKNVQFKLEPFRELFQRYSIRATGNAHIDMAWLWPASETVDVVRRTFGTALQLMNEYPDYTFTQSSAQANAWLDEKYPDIAEGIKKRVQEGRWEIVGGMWVEPDLNMPDGESIVRQLLIGKRYFKNEFGKDVNIGWNPDSFGYNWQLPQIYKKSGVDYFVTQKIYWNDTTKFPHKLFWWQSPDGSRILTYFPHDYVNSMEPARMAKDVADYVPKHKDFPEIMHLYGIGDHGGGPTRLMLDREKLWASNDVVYPKLAFGTAASFFKDVEAKLPQLDLPLWNGELYLEYHRGVYTTQAETKRHNRRSEELLLNAEKVSAIDTLFGRHYAGKEIEGAWKKVLFNQFHDVAAGSGINAIYRDADRDYAEVAHVAGDELRSSLSELGRHVNTRGEGVPLLVFNPLGWDRSDVAEAEVQMPAPTASVHVVDSSGKTVLSQLVSKDSTNNVKLLISTNDVPSLGYRLFRVLPGKGIAAHSDLVASGTQLENQFLRVKVDPTNGCITSIFDKRTNHESIAPGTCGNLLQAFRDKPKDWDAWNIDSNFEDEKWEIKDAQEVKLVESGPVRSAIRVKRKFQDSTFVQDIVLYAATPRVDVVTDADWHEKHILIKAGITVPVESNLATFEIPYGSIERPTTRNTPEEKAKFEVPALRWGDLSDNSFGVSLLNESKYGYDAKGNVLRLSLLRSPVWPDPHADEGRHHFTYSFYPHGADWKQGTVRQGYQLNYKLLTVNLTSHGGDMPTSWSFVQMTPANLVLTAVKKAEDDDGVLFRFYELAGKTGDANLKFAQPIAQAFETNLMEQQGTPLVSEGSTAKITVKAYEIKTVKVIFKKSGATAPAKD